MAVRTHDKIRISSGQNEGERAVVERMSSRGKLLVRLTRSGKLVPIASDKVTNFSAAARKAWKTMPRRKVGRPRGRTLNRISVTLRIDKTIWSRFKTLESSGSISGRSEVIEMMLTEKLGQLEESGK